MYRESSEVPECKRHKPMPIRDKDRVFLFKPAEKTGEALAQAFHGPYRVLEVEVNTAKIWF